jgi:hypothetical protein
MSNQKSPYSFGGNGAGSLAQSISKIGEAFGGLRKEKQRLNDKMLDSEIRIRERAIADSLKSSLKKKEMKTAGKQERKTYKKQVNTNVKAAERLTGTEKGQGVVKPGSKVSFGRERMDFTSRDAAPAQGTPTSPASKTAKPKTSAKPSTVKETAKAVAKTAGKQLATTAKEGAVALGAAAGGAITKTPAGARAGAAVAQVAADAVEKGVKSAVAKRKAAAPAPRKAK